jgi:hypothetical protein
VSWHPALSSIERATDRPQDRPRPLTDTQRAEGSLKVIGLFERCWCGSGYQHDWPGKNTGSPHPRTEAA